VTEALAKARHDQGGTCGAHHVKKDKMVQYLTSTFFLSLTLSNISQRFASAFLE
jgi:hypothetical protein